MKNVVKVAKALILPLILVVLVNLTGCSEEQSDMVLELKALDSTQEMFTPMTYYKAYPLVYYKVHVPTEKSGKVRIAVMTSDKGKLTEVFTGEDLDLAKLKELFFNFSDLGFHLNINSSKQKDVPSFKSVAEFEDDKLLKKIMNSNESTSNSFPLSKEQFATGKSTCLFFSVTKY